MPLKTMEEVRSLVTSTIAEQLAESISVVTPEKNFVDDLGVDSLDVYELAMALEDECEVEITDDEMIACRTVQQAIDLIAAKRSITA